MNFQTLLNLSFADVLFMLYILFLVWHFLTKFFRSRSGEVKWFYLTTFFSTFEAIFIDLLFLYNLLVHDTFSIWILIIAFYASFETFVEWDTLIYVYYEYLEDEETEQEIEAVKQETEEIRQAQNEKLFKKSFVEKIVGKNTIITMKDNKGHPLDFKIIDNIPLEGKEFLILSIKNIGYNKNLHMICRFKKEEKYVYESPSPDQVTKAFNIYYDKQKSIEKTKKR